jgi:hypothetical protein
MQSLYETYKLLSNLILSCLKASDYFMGFIDNMVSGF